jgi:ribosomal protein S6--L-glutamate ligase
MGLNVCGVDMLRSNHGPVIMEVNSSPGLKGIEEASGKDIASMIIQFIEKRFETLETTKDKLPTTRTRTRGKG